MAKKKLIIKNIHASARKKIEGLISMNEGAKGETSPKARIIQGLIYAPGRSYSFFKIYKNI